MFNFKLLFLLLLCLSSRAQSSQILKIPLAQNDTMLGKLSLPVQVSKIKTLVIFVPGTGPNTYLNKRKIGGKEISYYDLFIQEFNKRGIAFFSYNRKGVTISNTAPMFDSVSLQLYKRSTPSLEAADLVKAITYLKSKQKLQDYKMILLGWSEGTIIAPLTALSKNANVDALVLAGYANESMMEIVKYQNTDISTLQNLMKYFDSDSNKVVSTTEYNSQEKTPSAVRISALKNASFSSLDLNSDSVLNDLDWTMMLKSRYDKIIDAFERKDEDWIWKNYFRVTNEWYAEHKKLEANKTRLLKLSIPIVIVQGLDDKNTPASGAYNIENSFSQANKTNLKCFYFPAHNHDLNYTDWPYKGTVSPGLTKIFDVIPSLFNSSN